MKTPQRKALRVSGGDHRLRLDRFLRKAHPDFSRGHIEALLRTGMVRVNGTPQAQSHFLKEGDQVVVEEPAPARATGSVRVLCRSEHALVVGKPPGLPTNPVSAGSPSLLSEASLLIEEGSLGIVHRLDADTSGVLLLSRSPSGHRTIESLFRKGSIRKRYATLTVGAPRLDQGLIDEPLLRKKSGKTVISPEGLRSQTEYTVRKRLLSGLALIEAWPKTGRMHQVRVHLAHVDCPILGDAVYGRPGPSVPAPRLWLHSLSIEIPAAAAGTLGIPEVTICPLWPDLEEHLLAQDIEIPAAWSGGGDSS